MNKKVDIILKDCETILRRVDFRVFKNKKVLVTGANGFIGQYVVSAFHAANQKYNLNCRIYCVSLHGPGAVIGRYLPDKNIVFKKIDLTKPFRIQGNFNYIFHAAGYGQPSKFVNDPFSTIATNVYATEELLKIAERSHGTFVLFSSAEVYGEMPAGATSFKESFGGNAVSSESPRAVYAASKRLGEAIALFFAKHRGVRVRIIRISAVYGPGAPANDTRVMSDFIRKAFSSKQINLLDRGTAAKTYGYLADVIAMIFYVALRGKSTVYNVGGRDTMSIQELAERIGAYCGATVRIPRVASRAYFVGGDPRVVKLNLSKIKKEMKNFSFTPFRVGLANTIAWARQIGIADH